METYTIQSFTQRIASLYSKGAPSDESRLTHRHIYSVGISNRATLLEQQSKKKQKINQQNFQTITIELEDLNTLEVGCISLPTNCTYYKSKFKLPRILSDYNKMLIQSVTSIDNRLIFNESNVSKVKYSSGNKYGKKPLVYYLENDYIIIPYEHNTPKVIKLTAVFDDPIEAYNIDCNYKNTCGSYLDLPFPIDKSLESTVVQMSVEELIQVFNQNQEDVTNNSRDSVIETSK